MKDMEKKIINLKYLDMDIHTNISTLKSYPLKLNG